MRGWARAFAALLIGLILSGALVSGSAHASNMGPLVVSLTFDDGFADAAVGSQVLRDSGLRGTFYVNSGNIDAPGRLSLSDLRDISRQGNEVAGHTVDHAQLAGETYSEQLREICDDRVKLADWGFRPTDFAYPYGSSDVSAEKAARTCGYNSARSTGGLRGDSCLDCPRTESIPSGDPYQIRAYPSIVTGTDIHRVERDLAAAAAAGSGWITLVFHNVCDRCSDMAVTENDLRDLATWLASHQKNGIQVRTVGDVIGGQYLPPAVGPFDGRPAGVLVNADLEQPALSDGGMAGDGSPYCWDRIQYGQAQARWSKVVGSRLGDSAQQAQVSSVGSGDVKLLLRRDLGACSPAVSGGVNYRLASTVRGDQPVQFVVYVADSNGHWRFLEHSPSIGVNPQWTQVAWATGPLPSDVSRLSFGIRITSPGEFGVDNFAMSVDESRTARVVIAAAGCAGIIILSGACVLLAFRRQAAVPIRGKHSPKVRQSSAGG